MWLLPRTDLAEETGPIYCDKVGEHHPDSQLTHMVFDEGAGVWRLHQRQTAFGQDELLATLPCNSCPGPIDHWHLVHPSFGGRGTITVDKWTLNGYKRKMAQVASTSASGTTSLQARVEELSRELKVMMCLP